MRSEEIDIQTPNLRLRGLAWGPVNGIPVLAIHGWLDNAASFAAISGNLPGIRLIALDLPGHGQSEHRPHGTSYYADDYVMDIIAFANELGWQRFSRLGHSMGAALASIIASILPERIISLAVIDNLGPRSSLPEDGPIMLESKVLHSLSTTKKGLTIYANTEEAAKARLSSKKIPPQLRMSYLNTLALTERGTRVTENGITWSSDPRLLIGALYYFTQEQVLAFLKRISAPTLLLRASKGNLWKRPYMQERYDIMRNLTLVDVSGPHHVHMENARKVAEHALSFFRTNAP